MTHLNKTKSSSMFNMILLYFSQESTNDIDIINKSHTHLQKNGSFKFNVVLGLQY